jgi:hypothetical protein
MMAHEEDGQTVQAWLAAFPHRAQIARQIYDVMPGETVTMFRARIFKGLCYDLSLAIDVFGYEAVYFGVGCEVFPEAAGPWDGDGQY